MRIAIFTETFIHKNTAAANQAAVLQKGLQQGLRKQQKLYWTRVCYVALLVNPIISIVKVLIKYMHICWTIT